MKDKRGETVTEAFKTIFKEGLKPQYLWTDKGKEYCNKHMKELLEKNNITLYLTENEEKSSVCERWNLTIKTKMGKEFTVQGNTQYLSILPKKLGQYNNTKHSSIKITAVEASKTRMKLPCISIYYWFSHDVAKIQNKKLWLLPRFYVHDALEQLKTNFHTNFRVKRVLGLVIEYA